MANSEGTQLSSLYYEILVGNGWVVGGTNREWLLILAEGWWGG